MVSSKHSVIESDKAKLCTKSINADAFFMAPIDEVGKIFDFAIKEATGKK